VPGYLECVSRFADAVIALDDGSSDATGELLQRSELVRRLLRKPPRATYSGWDDRANRQALLDEAIRQGYEWALFLDADERIAADDAAALRELVERQADPDHAYMFRVFRMIEDEWHYDRAGLWVARLFAPRPGQELPPERLHLVPVPTSIPADRWRRTTVRIQHLASITPERRQGRLLKYQQVDADGRWQRDYSGLVATGGERVAWEPRAEGLPPLVPEETDPAGRTGSEVAPVLSAIVISRDGEEKIERSVRSLVDQECPISFEVIVVVSGGGRTAELVRRRFPQVKLVVLPEVALPGAARNAGLAVARGRFVSFPGSHVEVPPGSLAARADAHLHGYTMVTGSVLNGTRTPCGWAAYFLDHADWLPGRPSGELAEPPHHCSYARGPLVELGGFPEDLRVGEDTVVNAALWQRGHRAYRARGVPLIHRNPCDRPTRLVAHHFQRGRGFARIQARTRSRASMLRSLLAYPTARLARTDEHVRLWGAGLARRYARVRPLVVAGVLAAWAGMWFELLIVSRAAVQRAAARNAKR
jgi:glycosyltransferase involved in cell wall biosynthesis